MILWAIARKTIFQAIRLKAAAFVVLAFLAAFPFILSQLKSYGSPKAELQVLLTYSLGMIASFLSLLTVFLGAWTLCGEIQDRQIFSLDTKPVRRWQILLGQWIGLMLLNAALLAAMALPTYALARWLEGRAKPQDRKQIWDELLIGRRGVRPFLPDLTAQVRKEYEKRKKEGALPEDVPEDQILPQIHHEVYLRLETIPPRMTKTWEFRDLPSPQEISKGRPLTLRFKIYSTNPVAKRQTRGKWKIWHRYGSAQFQVPSSTATIGVFQELSVPPEVLPQEGKLLVAYTNLDASNEPAIFPLADGIELLYPTLSFNQNFVNSCLLVLFRIGFLGIVAIACGTFLTFPMALTVSLTAWLLCTVANYMLEVADYPLLINIYSSRRAEGPDWLDNFFRLYLRSLFSLVPNFSHYNPVPRLADGREVGYSLVGTSLLFLLLIRGGIVAAVSAFIFHARELAKLAR